MNLLGRHSNGVGETHKLLALMLSAGFQILHKGETEVYLKAPFKYGYKILVLRDNGGELGVEWVNERTLTGKIRHDVPTDQSAFNGPVAGEVVYTWVMKTLDDEPIDYRDNKPTFDESDWELPYFVEKLAEARNA